ncbi:hypothetical protein ACI6QG_08725 [Roseococcus sp. DSY-14]|uniref:hypothetical protein n=1 Tax=Roseococcus sp. DSY-14 TaxID=3369650 RepID=UPI00387B7D45
MGNPAKAAALAKRFEPILLFHPEERFLPLDPKRWIEACALWRADPPFTDRAGWAQLRPRGSLAALDTVQDKAGGRAWIGADPAFGTGAQPLEEPAAAPEFFLELAGWEPAIPPALPDRHAALDPAAYLQPFAGTEPWYSVEYLDNVDLRRLTPHPLLRDGGLDLFTAIATNPALRAPQLLVFHFLYPVREEALEGCEGAGEGDLFGRFSGEWGAVALLLDQADAPLMIGLTTRNPANPATAPGGERRVSLRAFPWAQVDAVAGPDGGLHPRIHVARGTHGHHLSAAAAPLVPASPGAPDPARQSCGAVETLDGLLGGERVLVPAVPADPGEEQDTALIVAKILLIPPPGLGLLFAGLEGAFGRFGSYAQPEVLATPAPEVRDVLGGPAYGRILRPAGLPLPEAAQAAQVLDWNVRRFQAPPPDSRFYPFVVDRGTQRWWPPRPAPRPNTQDLPGAEGWAVRWGPRVSSDPNGRRCGMRCPDFALLMMEAVAVAIA